MYLTEILNQILTYLQNRTALGCPVSVLILGGVSAGIPQYSTIYTTRIIIII